MSEARELGHSYVGTEHTLLGLIREERGVAAQVLQYSGINLDNVRAETLRILGTEAPAYSEPRTIEASPRSTADAHLPRSARRVREIIAAAHDVAVEYQLPIVVPEFVAIALLRHEGGMANAALDRLGLDRAAALSALNDVAPFGSEPVSPDSVLTPNPKLVTAIEAMEELRREAKALSAGSHHLLLALLMTSIQIDRVFAEQNINAAQVREAIRWISG